MNGPIRRMAVVLLVFALVLSASPEVLAQAGASGQGPSTASLQGRVFGADRVTPVPGAVVRAVKGDGVQVYSSLPSDAKGAYSITGISLGNYEIVVEVSDGVYVVEKPLAFTEAKSYGLSLANVPSENVEKRVPAVDKPVKGYAWTLEGNPKGAFWKSPGGIAIIAGGALAILLLALNNDDNGDNNKGSSSTP